MHILQIDSTDPRTKELIELLKSKKFNIDILRDDIDLALNKVTQIAHYNGRDILLTKKEFNLLSLLLENKNKTVTRETLIRETWNMTIDPFSNTIEAHIRTLRKKLGEPNIIHTIPRIGYKLSVFN